VSVAMEIRRKCRCSVRAGRRTSDPAWHLVLEEEEHLKRVDGLVFDGRPAQALERVQDAELGTDAGDVGKT